MSGDVFIGAAANAPLQGAASGNIVTRYITFAITCCGDQAAQLLDHQRLLGRALR